MSEVKEILFTDKTKSKIAVLFQTLQEKQAQQEKLKADIQLVANELSSILNTILDVNEIDNSEYLITLDPERTKIILTERPEVPEGAVEIPLETPEGDKDCCGSEECTEDKCVEKDSVS